MRNIFKLILLTILLALPQDSRGTEFLLARTGESDEEYARCFSKNCTIEYKGDTVYSEGKYDNLRDNIYNHLEFLKTVKSEYNDSQTNSTISGVKKYYPNLMSVILAATGKGNRSKFERVFFNLYGKCQHGKYIFSSESDTSKFVVFYSNHNSGINKDYDNRLLVRLVLSQIFKR